MNQSFASAAGAVSHVAGSALLQLEFAANDMRTLEELGRLNGSDSIAAIARQTARRLAEVRAELLSLSPEVGEFAALTPLGCAALREVGAV